MEGPTEDIVGRTNRDITLPISSLPSTLLYRPPSSAQLNATDMAWRFAAGCLCATPVIAGF